MNNIGIIGNGFVGSAISGGFGLSANVMIWDKDPLRATHTLPELLETCEFVFISVPTLGVTIFKILRASSISIFCIS